MATSLVDLLLVLIWPFLFSAAVWAIAIRALGEADEISAVVQALTRSKTQVDDAPASANRLQSKFVRQLQKPFAAMRAAGMPAREIKK